MPKIQGQDRRKINATLWMEQEDWDALEDMAKALGMTRTQLVTRIARGEVIQERISINLTQKEILGKS